MTDKQDPIAHAARLLREAAEELRQAHAYNNSEGWENETDAKAAYDDHLAAAQALEDWEAAVGAGGVQALSAAPAAKKSALRTYPNPIVPLIKPVSEQEKMRALYLASSNLMAYLGRNGAIHSDGHAADAMMDCLNDLDGGGFDETLFAASPTPPAEQTFITPETGNSASAKGAAITSESGTPPAEQRGVAYAAPPDERAAFEAQFPVPGGVHWDGTEYVVKDSHVSSYRCNRFEGQWEAWKARASHGQAPATQPQAGAVPLEEARRLFDAGWKAAALFCDREDVVADGIIGFGACPQFEAAFSAAHGIKRGQHGTK